MPKLTARLVTLQQGHIYIRLLQSRHQAGFANEFVQINAGFVIHLYLCGFMAIL